MAYTVPYKLYEMLEETLGKEKASVFVETLEQSIRESIQETRVQQRVEISEELKKELASKYDIKMVEEEIKHLEEKMEQNLTMIKQEIRSVEERFNYKLKINTLFLTIVIILSQLLLNRENFEFLVKLLGIVR